MTNNTHFVVSNLLWWCHFIKLNHRGLGMTWRVGYCRSNETLLTKNWHVRHGHRIPLSEEYIGTNHILSLYIKRVILCRHYSYGWLPSFSLSSKLLFCFIFLGDRIRCLLTPLVFLIAMRPCLTHFIKSAMFWYSFPFKTCLTLNAKFESLHMCLL